MSYRGIHRPSEAERAAIRQEIRDQLLANARKRTMEELERASGDDLAHTLMLLDFVPTDARGVALVASLKGRSIWADLLWNRVPLRLRDTVEDLAA